MAVMHVENGSSRWLVVWLEPFGEDRWLERGEMVCIRTDNVGEELAFNVETHATEEERAAGIENMTIYIENCSLYADVTDRDGNVVECGHKRPEEIDREWAARRAAAEEELSRMP
ncbi:hypothetical protein AB0M48_23120 [Lentzea sp. NPDC051208]|uniref:hypothetical protein n=1 Tax=Lentzea sp. NPDC051208 TaxID=3154642 RepID=UPI00341B9600